MASLRVHPDRLEIHLTPAEKTLAFRRENVVIARENIRSVTITDDPWIWVRGIRSPGALVPLVVAVGVWKFHGGKDFLAIKRRRQAVVIDLTGDDFARVVLSTNHAPDLIASLKLDADADVATVAESAGGEQSNDPATPAKPAKRARAAKVAKPVEVTDPVAPAAGVKPARRARTATVVTAGEVGEVISQAAEPTEPTEPTAPEKPARPSTRSKRTTAAAKPAEATEPAAPAKPAKRASRATVPPVAQTAADAVNPVAEPDDSEKPVDSDKPAE